MVEYNNNSNDSAKVPTSPVMSSKKSAQSYTFDITVEP